MWDKTLLCYWHPDRNSHPNATEITAHLNRAYDCYQSFQEMSSQDNAPLWTKIRAGFLRLDSSFSLDFFLNERMLV